MKLKFLVYGILSCNFLFAQIDKQSMSNFSNLSLIQVTLGGGFIVQGTFPASANERVDQFVTRIFEEAKQNAHQLANDEKTILEITKKFDRIPFRDITLKRADGSNLKLDLFLFRMDGNFNNNPYLKADDVLIFPLVDSELNFVSINGAVNSPTTFQFVEGDKLSDALFFAGGINPAYGNVSSAKIYRLSTDGLSLNTFDINIKENVELKRGDRIQLIGVQPEKNNYSILVLGEVNNPGYISVSKDLQNISEVITRAGGFTQLSDKRRVKVFSSDIIPHQFFEKQFKITDDRTAKFFDDDVVQFLEQIEKYSFSRMSNLTEEDTAYFNLENRLRFLLDAQTLDVTDEQLSKDHPLLHGDIVIVPKQNDFVYVYGQVGNPSKIKFLENADCNYYIEKAGGYGEFYDEEIMLIKGTTKEWISMTERPYKIEPGDYIWVPRVEVKSFLTQVREVSVYLGVVGNLATIILLLIQLTK